MPQTYDPTLATTKDQVRFLVRDNVSGAMVLDDGEIAWLLSTEANVYMAAALAADGIAQRIAQSVLSGGTTAAGILKSKKVDDLELTYDTTAITGLSSSLSAKDYVALAESLRRRGRSGYQLPWAGATSVADKNQRRADTDRPPSQFEIGMDDNPMAPNMPDDRFGRLP